MLYGDKVDTLRKEVRDLHARRLALTEELAAYGGGPDDRATRDAFAEVVMEGLAMPYLVANALEKEVDARLEEAREEGRKTDELEAEAE